MNATCHASPEVHILHVHLITCRDIDRVRRKGATWGPRGTVPVTRKAEVAAWLPALAVYREQQLQHGAEVVIVYAFQRPCILGIVSPAPLVARLSCRQHSASPGKGIMIVFANYNGSAAT